MRKSKCLAINWSWTKLSCNARSRQERPLNKKCMGQFIITLSINVTAINGSLGNVGRAWLTRRREEKRRALELDTLDDKSISLLFTSYINNLYPCTLTLYAPQPLPALRHCEFRFGQGFSHCHRRASMQTGLSPHNLRFPFRKGHKYYQLIH